MSLKKWIDDHPLPVALAVAVSAASTTGGVAKSMLETRFETERAALSQVHLAEVDALKTRLVSIERRIGGEDKTYFDISQLLITPDRVKVLDADYKTADAATFYYTVPPGGEWTYQRVSEGDLLDMKLGGDARKSMPEVLGALTVKNVHLWKATQNFQFKPKLAKALEGLPAPTLNFFPMVALQTVDEAEWTKTVGDLHEAIASSELSEVSEKLDRLLERTASDASGEPPSGAPSSPNQPSKASAPTSQAGEGIGDSRLELEESLGKLFRGDIAAALLGGLVGQFVSLPDRFQDTQVSVSTVQKKGPVLYLQTSMKFSNAELAGSNEPGTLLVDREIFIVSNSRRVYLVQVEVPTVDGRSNAYQWVAQWLSGVRIPL